MDQDIPYPIDVEWCQTPDKRGHTGGLLFLLILELFLAPLPVSPHLRLDVLVKLVVRTWIH